MHSFGLHSPNISFPAVTQKGACSDCIVHSFAFHCDLNEMQILVDMRYMTSNIGDGTYHSSTWLDDRDCFVVL